MALGNLPDRFRSVLARAELRGLAADTSIIPVDGLTRAFEVPRAGEVLVHPAEAMDDAELAATLRHALELALLLRLWPDAPVLAGLAAARTAVLFSVVERASVLPDQASGLATLAREEPIGVEAARALWPPLSRYQPGAPAAVPPDALAALHRVWPLLGPAEWLMQTGGDVRLVVDPRTGLNGYGCSHRPRPWAVTFASSTASSSSERGYEAAEALRRRVLQRARGEADAVGDALEDVRGEIARCYGLPEGALVVLAPSGTDCELLAVAAAQRHPAGRPLTSVLVAPEETGTGVPLAAAGRHFAIDSAQGAAVTRGAPIAGFREDTRVETVPLRDARGLVRPPATVITDCLRLVEAAASEGRTTLLHCVDVSKTGLFAPGEEALAALQARWPGHVDVVVDACQARLSAPRVRSYVARGWIVLLTGSKFLTGPPFSGAVVFPPSMRARFGAPGLPAGLRDYSGRAEWPRGCWAAAGLAERGNLGLAARWAAALAELRAFDAVSDAFKHHAISHFCDRVAGAIDAASDLRLIDVPPLRRAGEGPLWDDERTILSFAMRRPATGDWLDVAAARQAYGWLNADLGPALSGMVAGAEARLARRRFHLGQPARLVLDGAEAGVLRVSAGARLVSGEPAWSALPPQDRLEREVQDALALLAKVSLILQHWPALQRASPMATYA